MNNPNPSIKHVDTLIVGGGYSAIPLLRELEKDGKEALVISEGKPIWSHLEKHDRLDFDLVSSLYTSTFSFELAEKMQEKEFDDRYQTSKEFYDLHKKYKKRYEDRMIQDSVIEVDNYTNHSLVYTKNHMTYQAKNVIFATAFRRKIHESLNTFDFNESIEGKTVAITSIGDSANLIIAKLVSLGAKVKLVSNGFIALDKFVTIADKHVPEIGFKTLTVDQLEFHNVAKISKWLYTSLISAGYIQAYFYPFLSKFLFHPSIAVDQPLSGRKGYLQKERLFALKQPFTKRNPLVNGRIAIKYWPIDMYYKKFASDLENSIEQGFLLNDLFFFIDQGFVELWDKEKTDIDRSQKQITSNGKTTSYDYLIEGDREEPNLPLIYRNGNKDDSFTYCYKNQYMGLIPQNFDNIYLLGYTRPFTGGLANIVEMQCLLIHKMISNPEFNKKIHENMPNKIKKYNSMYYASDENTPADHVLSYGMYNDEVAKLIGIRPRLRDCRSIKDIKKYFLFPNNTYYYREQGEYKVDNLDRVVAHIEKTHNSFSIVAKFSAFFVILELNALLAILLSPLSLWISVPLAILHFKSPLSVLLLMKLGMPTDNRPVWYSHLILLSGVQSPISFLIFQTFWAPLLSLLFIYMLIHAGSYLGWNRMVFADLRSKRSKEVVDFFATYKETFKRVLAKRNK